MRMFAIADLHLSFGIPSKTMEIFGPSWKDYQPRMAKAWQERIAPDDLVLIAGDISWAMRLEEALPDLDWIDRLPGSKVLIPGNHDYWWPSKAKLAKVAPPSMRFLHHGEVAVYGEVAVTGTRLWDTKEYQFGEFIDWQPRPESAASIATKHDEAGDEKIFERELGRLERCLAALPEGKRRFVMTHYPPIGAALEPSRTSELLETCGVEVCVFGHLHQIRPGALPFGKARGVQYHLTSADYLDFVPLQLA